MKVLTFILLLLGLTHSGFLWADLKRDEAIALLRAAKAEKNLTDQEKLGRYRCDMISKYLGFKDTVIGKARKYSCNTPEIGVALYAGEDLGDHSPEKVAQYFKDEFTKNNINAEVFIQKNHPYGTSMGFYINGESLIRNPVDPLKGIEILKGMAAEALLILYTEKRISTWPKGNATAKK